MKNNMKRRTVQMLLGIFLISISVAFYRLCELGTDPFTCLNLGVSMFIGTTFGTWQLIINTFIFIAMIFLARKYIGAGTFINMIGVGYIADFVCWLVKEQLQIEAGMAGRVMYLAVGTIILAIGCALYIEADLGISPYDSVGFILEKLTGGRLPFHFARICSDVTVTILGVIFCALSGNSIWLVVGIGTIINAVCLGPLIQFFRKYFKIEA